MSRFTIAGSFNCQLTECLIGPLLLFNIVGNFLGFLSLQVLDQVAYKSRSKALKAKLKSVVRVFEKVVLEYGGDMSSVTDFVRGKVFCDSIDQLGLVVACLVLCDPQLASEISLAGLIQRANSARVRSPQQSPDIMIRILNVKNRIGWFVRLGIACRSSPVPSHI